MCICEGAGDVGQGSGQSNMFEVLCESVHTSMLAYNATLQEVSHTPHYISLCSPYNPLCIHSFSSSKMRS